MVKAVFAMPSDPTHQLVDRAQHGLGKRGWDDTIQSAADAARGETQWNDGAANPDAWRLLEPDLPDA